MKVLEEQFRSACHGGDRLVRPVHRFPRGHGVRPRGLRHRAHGPHAPAARTSGRLVPAYRGGRAGERPDVHRAGRLAAGAKAKYDHAIAALRNTDETEFTLGLPPGADLRGRAAPGAGRAADARDRQLPDRGERGDPGRSGRAVRGPVIVPTGAGPPSSGRIGRPCIEVPLQAGEVKGLSSLGGSPPSPSTARKIPSTDGFTGTRPFTGSLPARSEGDGDRRGRKQDGRSDRQGRGRETVAACPWRRASRGRESCPFWRPPTRRPTSGRSSRRTCRARFAPSRATPGSSPSGSTEGERRGVQGQDPLPGRRVRPHRRNARRGPGGAGVPLHGGDGGLRRSSPAWWSGDDFGRRDPRHGPTGHTLRLLELPYDYSRQVEMMVASGRTTPGRPAPRGSSTRSYGA